MQSELEWESHLEGSFVDYNLMENSRYTGKWVSKHIPTGNIMVFGFDRVPQFKNFKEAKRWCEVAYAVGA